MFIDHEHVDGHQEFSLIQLEFVRCLIIINNLFRLIYNFWETIEKTNLNIFFHLNQFCFWTRYNTYVYFNRSAFSLCTFLNYMVISFTKVRNSRFNFIKDEITWSTLSELRTFSFNGWCLFSIARPSLTILTALSELILHNWNELFVQLVSNYSIV